VFVDIGARVGSSVNASASTVEKRFSAMGRKLKIASAEMSVAMSRFSSAATSIGGLLAAGGIGFTLSKAIGAGAELDHEMQALRNAGRNSTQVAQAIAAANKTILDLPTSTLASNLAMINETTSAFGDYGHAIANVGRNQKLAFLLNNSSGEHGGDGQSTQQIGSLIRMLEMRGAANDEGRYTHETEMAYKAMMFTRGRVGGNEFKAFAATGNPLVKSLSDEYLYKIAPSLMQEYGADQAGTMHQALTNTILGKVGMGGKSYAEEWLRLGLLDKSQAKFANNGSIKGWKAGAITGTDTFLRNPLQWAEQFLLPALRKNGVNADDQIAVQKELSTLVGKNTASRLLGSLINTNDRKRLHKDAAFTDEVPGVDKTYMNTLLNDPKAGPAALKASFTNLMAAISAPVLIPAARAMARLADGVNKLAVVFQKHPRLGKAVSEIVVALAGLVALSFVGKVFEFVAAGLGVFSTAAGIAVSAIKPLFGAVGALGPQIPLMMRIGGALRILFVEGLLTVGLPIIGLIVALGVAIAVLIAKWNGIKAFFRGFADGFKKALSPETKAAMERLGSAISGVFSAIGSALTPVVNSFSAFFGWIGKLFLPADESKWKKGGETFGGVVGGMVNSLTGFINKIAEAIESVGRFFHSVSGQGLVQNVVNGFLTGGQAGAVAGIGQTIADGIGWPASSLPAQLRPPHRALGGPVRGGSTYEINESGQELFAPGRSGSIITARATSALLAAANSNARGGGSTTQVHVGGIVIQGANDPAATAREVERVLKRLAGDARGYLHD
jgi:hypothetical protein